jgi:hypothetical protein
MAESPRKDKKNRPEAVFQQHWFESGCVTNHVD